MEKIRLILLIMFMSILLAGISQKPEAYDKDLTAMYKNTVPLITPVELSEKIESDTSILVLDAREINEYKVSHIPGAKFIGYNNFNMKLLKDIPKDASIVVYCSLGVRSELIAEKLINDGFTNVENLYGGIFEWVYNDMEVVNKKEEVTQKVHTYDENWGEWLLKGEKVY